MKAGLVQQNTVFVFFVILCKKARSRGSTERNEDTEGFQNQRSRTFVSFVIFCLKSSPAENLFFQKQTQLKKVFAVGQEQSLCFLYYSLY